MENDNFFDFLDEIQQSRSPLPVSKPEKKPPEPKEQVLTNERTEVLPFPFFIDLVEQFKGKLKDIRNYTRAHHDKCGDKEFITYLSHMIAEEIRKTELVRDSLLNYVRINNPVLKTDTVNTLLEEELKKCEVELETRKIKLFKTLEKNLPETVVPDDQLRYILSCLFQYILTSMSAGGGIGLYTRSLALHKETGEGETPGRKESRQVEVLIVYAAYKKVTGQYEPASEIAARQRERGVDLTLRLVDEIVKKNRGTMKFEEDEKKLKTPISLRFPMERRKVVYYQPISESSPEIRESKTTFEKLSSLEEKAKRR
jgi:hypothetical protein